MSLFTERAIRYSVILNYMPTKVKRFEMMKIHINFFPGIFTDHFCPAISSYMQRMIVFIMWCYNDDYLCEETETFVGEIGDPYGMWVCIFIRSYLGNTQTYQRKDSYAHASLHIEIIFTFNIVNCWWIMNIFQVTKEKYFDKPYELFLNGTSYFIIMWCVTCCTTMLYDAIWLSIS